MEAAQLTGGYSLALSTYSRIAFATLPHGKLYAAARLYDIAQHRARRLNGSAVFTPTEIGQYAAGLGVSWRKVRDGLRAGEGVFWDAETDPRDKRRKIYRMRSKAKVCLALGIDGPSPRVDLPKIAYQGSAEHYKAHVYAAIFQGNRGDFARSTLEKLTGHSRPTLYEWERIAGMTVTPNLLEAVEPTNEAEINELAQQRKARFWLMVEGPRKRRQPHFGPICTVTVLDDDDEPRADYDQRVQHARKEADRPGRANVKAGKIPTPTTPAKRAVRPAVAASMSNKRHSS